MNLFGSVDVIGRTIPAILRGEETSMRVTGVFEDLPRNSHMNFRAFARITNADREECGWSCVNGFVYLKLRPGATAEDVHRGMPAWAQYLGEILPLTHFNRIVRAVMLKGAEFPAIASEAAWLAGFILLFAAMALLRFRRTLD